MVKRCRGNELRLRAQLRIKLIDPQTWRQGEVILLNAPGHRQDFAFRGGTATRRRTSFRFRYKCFQSLCLRP